jgi:adenosylcobinamide kinase/adenosylcobinamide-phosphate guanylyltransferase
MSVKITFVIGGARSGKSSFVLNEVSEMKGSKAYIATGEALDDEMQDRIRKHKEDRGQEWDSYEEPVNIAELISKIKDKYEIVVIDCLTLWLSNVLIRQQSTENRSQNLPTGQAGTDVRIQTTEKHINDLIETLNKLKNSVCSLESGFCNLYIVSNDVGMGIVPENPLAREFRDLTGFLNQKVAEVADEVYMVTAGIPIKIK